MAQLLTDTYRQLPDGVKRSVVCLSGGMDSSSLLLNLLADGQAVYGVSYDYGQKHKAELTKLKELLAYLNDRGYPIEHQVVDVSVLGGLFHSALTDESWKVPEGFYEKPNMKETVVPNRNAIFAAIAYGYALSVAGKQGESVALALGVHSGDHAIYPDCRPEFYEAIYQAFAIGNWDSEQVQLYLPYLSLDKHRILQDAQQSCAGLDLDFSEVFKRTLTSYEPDAEGRSSGKTGSDVERILAFHKLGVEDPIEYVDPWSVVLERALKFEEQHVSGEDQRPN